MGQTILTKEMSNNGIPVYSATIDNKPLGYISKNLNKIKLSYDDLVIPARGNSIGHVTYIIDDEASCTQTTIWMKLYLKKISVFLFYFFLCCKNKLFVHNGAAIPQITIAKIQECLFPLPPLAEQERIVKEIRKYEPLIAEYDKLEKQLTKLENEITDKLKKSILQYAIEGKLVKQDPNDEPASVLLEKIKAEKEKLIREGKIKRDKNESYIYQGDDKNYYEKINGKISNITEEIPFNIPNNWCWTRLPNVIYYNLGKTPDRHNKMFWENGTYNWISISDMKDREIILNTNEKITDLALKSCFNNKISPAGTLIMSFKLTVGRVSILGIDSVHNEAIVSIFPFIDLNKITRNFLMYSLGSLIQYCKATDAIKGATLNKEKINRLLIPFPPLNEQHKICIKIESLFDNIK